MPTETFMASRWTRTNLWFPTALEVTDTAVVRRKRTLFSNNEMSIHLQRIASVHIQTGIFWSDILIESTGGTDPIFSHGHHKADALRVKDLIEQAQRSLLPERAGPAPSTNGPSRDCPFCAETIKAAAKVCRFCGRDLPSVD
jgi:hypothetical protein